MSGSVSSRIPTGAGSSTALPNGIRSDRSYRTPSGTLCTITSQLSLSIRAVDRDPGLGIGARLLDAVAPVRVGVGVGVGVGVVRGDLDNHECGAGIGPLSVPDEHVGGRQHAVGPRMSRAVGLDTQPLVMDPQLRARLDADPGQPLNDPAVIAVRNRLDSQFSVDQLRPELFRLPRERSGHGFELLRQQVRPVCDRGLLLRLRELGPGPPLFRIRTGKGNGNGNGNGGSCRYLDEPGGEGA